MVIRLWSVSHVRGFVTPADFVRSRFDSPGMALLVAITGIVATMPYIALQLVGIQVVLEVMGIGGRGDSWLAKDLPLLLAVLSSFRNRPLANDLIVFGELGLAGEVRPVAGGEERLAEAAKHGFKRAIVPEANRPRKSVKLDIEVIAVARLDQALSQI